MVIKTGNITYNRKKFFTIRCYLANVLESTEK